MVVSTDVYGLFLLKLCHWKIKKMTAKLRRKVTAASPAQERFQDVICSKMMETGIPQIFPFHRTL